MVQKSQRTTWDEKNLVNNGIIDLSTGLFHQRYFSCRKVASIWFSVSPMLGRTPISTIPWVFCWEKFHGFLWKMVVVHGCWTKRKESLNPFFLVGGWNQNHLRIDLGGGFKYFFCSTLFGEDSHFHYNIFQMGWNHQLLMVLLVLKLLMCCFLRIIFFERGITWKTDKKNQPKPPLLQVFQPAVRNEAEIEVTKPEAVNARSICLLIVGYFFNGELNIPYMEDKVSCKAGAKTYLPAISGLFEEPFYGFLSLTNQDFMELFLFVTAQFLSMHSSTKPWLFLGPFPFGRLVVIFNTGSVFGGLGFDTRKMWSCAPSPIPFVSGRCWWIWWFMSPGRDRNMIFHPSNTVYGQNPAPPRMMIIPLFIGF